MGHRIWQGALAGSVAAFLAWALSYPFLPVNVYSLADPSSAAFTVESNYSLGSFYGWFANGLFGLLATLFIVIVNTGNRPWRKRIVPCLAAILIGPLLVAAGDALSDTIGIWLDKDNGNIHSVGALSSTVTWPLFLSTALCSSTVLSLGKRSFLLRRWLIATVMCAVASFLVHEFVSYIVKSVYYSVIGGTVPINRWELSAPSFLATHIAIGIGAGACLAIADMIAPRAWLNLSLDRNEGYSWTIDRPMSIGVSELADVRIPRDGMTMPVHACIEIRGSQYVLSHLGGQISTLVNNVSVQKVALQDGDVIRIGNTDMVFHIREQLALRRLHVDALYQAAVGTSAPCNSLEFSLIDPLGNVRRLAQGKTVIGRDAACAISLSWESTLSSVHAELNLVFEDLTIRDLRSTNGTKLNGSPIGTEPVPIKTGDLLELGSVRLRVQSNRPLL